MSGFPEVLRVTSASKRRRTDAEPQVGSVESSSVDAQVKKMSCLGLGKSGTKPRNSKSVTVSELRVAGGIKHQANFRAPLRRVGLFR